MYLSYKKKPMHTKQDHINSLQREEHLITHLHSKVEPAHLDYQPTEHQRTLEELLSYLTMMGAMMTSAMKHGAFANEDAEQFTQRAQEMDLESFPELMQQQTTYMITYLEEVTEEEWHEEIDPFGTGQMMARKQIFLELIVKGFAAYRMQLFLYIKQAGKHDLNTMNVWMGKDSQ